MATFFEHQHVARRNTKILVLLYVLAVIGVIVAVDLVLASAYVWTSWDSLVLRGKTPASYATLYRMVPNAVYGWGAAISTLVILAVSAWQVLRLAGGGAAVAEMAGARRVSPETRDPLERRLLNVVEEMAIASGVRVPAVYVMDQEPGINAFAAGYEVSHSVVAVTRGTLQALNRDELQGVVAHEFSHILNGDMRLNIRMIGVLAGIVFIGAVGEFLMRSVRGSRDSRASGGIFLAGLALLLIGYVGLFFARLIKAAVSRQREFLADASSVQFTRNPDGIAGALDQIRSSDHGAWITNRHAEDMSHMFFGQGVRMWLGALFDTHPPIDERIQRAHPRFEAESYRKTRPAASAAGEEAAAREGVSRREAAQAVLTGAAVLGGAVPTAGRRAPDAGAAWGRSAGESAALVGSLDGAKVDYAKRLLGTLPPGLRERLQQPAGARAALVALLLAPRDDVMRGQLEALKAAGLESLGTAAAALARRLGPAFHLPAIDLALPALKAADDAAKRELIAALEAVIHADRRVSLHEFVVLTLVRHQLEPKAKPGAAGSRKIAELQAECALVLSLVAHAGTRQDAAGSRAEALQKALAAGAKEMGIAASAPAAAALTLEAAGRALGALNTLAPMQKALLVKGLFAAVSHDGTIRVMEAELMRLVGAVLDCPLPPLLEAEGPATLAA